MKRVYYSMIQGIIENDVGFSHLFSGEVIIGDKTFVGNSAVLPSNSGCSIIASLLNMLKLNFINH